MKPVVFALVFAVVASCHKTDGASVAGCGAGSGAGSTTGSAAASPPADPGSAAPASGPAASGPHASALDELDRWLAPIYKLDVPARYKAMCAAGDVLHDKVVALKTLGPPAGGTAQAWSDGVDGLQAPLDGVRLCCKDLADYDKLTGAVKEGASNHEDCMKPVPDGFAALVKLVPGAKPPGAHANDPAMTPK